MKKVQHEVMRTLDKKRWPVKVDTMEEALELQRNVQANAGWLDTIILLQDIEVPDIHQLFTSTMGFSPNDDSLMNLPVDSGCGRDCATAILIAGSLKHVADPIHHAELIGLTANIIGTMWHG